MQIWLSNLMVTSPHLIYGVIVIVSFIEGPILAMLCGLLVKLGTIPFLLVFLALIIGDLLGDVFWYGVGRYFGHKFIKKFGKYFSIREENIESIKKIFHKYHNSILIISKVTMGFGFALVTLITAGIVKIPFGRYITLNLIGQFFWTGFLMSVGYFLGNLYLSFNNVLGKMSILALIVLVFFGLIGYGKFIKNLMKEKII